MSDDNRLEQIRARLEAATPGPMFGRTEEIIDSTGRKVIVWSLVQGQESEGYRGKVPTARFDKHGDAILSLNAHSDLRFLLDEVERLTWERDLAIAHDRQPYPTAEAYESACRIREELRQERDQLRAQLSAYRDLEDAARKVRRSYSGGQMDSDLPHVMHELEHALARLEEARKEK